MAFIGNQDLQNSLFLGKTLATQLIKTYANSLVAGYWYNTFQMTGYPLNGSYGGSSMVCTTMNSTTVGAIPTGINVSPESKHLLSVETMDLTTPPLYFMLVDMLAYYPNISLTSSALQRSTCAVGNNSLPTRGGVQHTGKNVFMFLESFVVPGATPAQCYIDYTAYGGVTGVTGTSNIQDSTLEGKPPVILNSGLTATSFSPFFPLPTNHIGVTSVQSIQISTSMGGAGIASLILCEPLCGWGVYTIGVPTNKTFNQHELTLPIIRDDACLAILVANQATNAASSFYFTLEFIWS